MSATMKHGGDNGQCSSSSRRANVRRAAAGLLAAGVGLALLALLLVFSTAASNPAGTAAYLSDAPTLPFIPFVPML